MQIDPETGMVRPYQTKIDRIWELEEALKRIAAGSLTLAECVSLAASLERTDARWRRDSPRSFDKVDKLQREGK